ncbi:MAG: LysR family transcriptional regulator [Elusimicrobia bacterium]|nr:LysR family transcriptional regulator [Elusimicrobiota bacterium]
MLDLDALHAFYWTAKLGGVGAAARRLHVTQPAVSQRLRQLETDLQRKLYGRAGYRIALTEEGEKVYRACAPAFETLEALETSLEGKSKDIQGHLRIMALSEFSKAFLLPKLRDFQKKHPGIRFRLEYRLPFEMLSALVRHDIDFAFTIEVPTHPQIEAVPVYVEELVCLGPSPARSLSWDDLRTIPWLSCRSEDHAWFEFEEILQKRGVQLSSPAIEVAEQESLMTLAAQGAGYVLTPLHSMKLRSVPGLVRHKLPFGPLKQTVYFCRLKTVPLGLAGEAFWRSIRAFG